ANGWCPGHDATNGLTSHGSGYSLELAATLRWFALLKQLREMRAVNACSPARVLARDVRNTFATESGQPLALLSPEFFSESHAVARSHVRSIRHRENQLTALKTWLRRRANRPATTANGDARVVYPLRDKRVLEFCISAPGSLKIRDGYRRYLVRGALQGILPDKICWRTSKSPFAPDYYVRYNAQLNKAKEFVAAIGPTDPVRSIVNVAELERSLYPVDEVRGTPAALATIPGSFYLICFLRQFAEFRP
ncbi:MAG: asparagine synthase-related protein, partial [Terriglobia bacterium]